MARKPNYGFEKRQKEILRAKKNEEKAERKQQRKELGEDYIDPALFGGVIPVQTAQGVQDVADSAPDPKDESRTED